jgi:hypothetical protein
MSFQLEAPYTMDLREYVLTLPDDQREQNQKTHRFDWVVERCCLCDARPWGYRAQIPCGSTPPPHVAPYWVG